ERFSAGDLVVLNGDGIGESHHGGFATRARVRADALVRLPADLSPEHAAALGTAGFPAMLAVLRLEDAGITPKAGDVLVTGAAGGLPRTCPPSMPPRSAPPGSPRCWPGCAWRTRASHPRPGTCWSPGPRAAPGPSRSPCWRGAGTG